MRIDDRGNGSFQDAFSVDGSGLHFVFSLDFFLIYLRIVFCCQYYKSDLKYQYIIGGLIYWPQNPLAYREKNRCTNYRTVVA